jgi:hypothetical protein
MSESMKVFKVFLKRYKGKWRFFEESVDYVKWRRKKKTSPLENFKDYVLVYVLNKFYYLFKQVHFFSPFNIKLSYK